MLFEFSVKTIISANGNNYDMIPSRNSSGNPGVKAYEAGPDRISIKFVDGVTYVYTNKSAGVDAIRHMKELAKSGRGLSTYISTTVREKYERKF